MAGPPEPPHLFGEHSYKGLMFPNVVLDSSIEAMKTFKVRPDDVWIVTFPKAGTHWMLEIAGLILAKGIPDDINRSLHASTIEMINTGQGLPRSREEELASPPDLSPFLDVIDRALSPRVITTHLPLSLLPPSLVKTGKVIYMARNPKDMLTSANNFLGKYIPWEKMFHDFLAGKCGWGPWPEHVKGCWDIKNEKNVLFLLYESMKKEPVKYIRQVAEHIGVSLTDDELQKVLEYSSFKGMKKSYEKAQESGDMVTAKDGHLSFMHKGVSGGWKSRFTVAENEMFDNWYQDKMADSDMSFQYE